MKFLKYICVINNFFIFYNLINIALIKELRSSQDTKKLEEFNSLRESIKVRIDDLDNFFEENFDDEFIIFFEKGRYQLKKLIQYEPNLINEIDSGNNMKAFILQKNSKDNFYEQDSGIKKNINYFKKNKNKSKSMNIFPQDNLYKLKSETEYLNKYINTNKTKVNNTSQRNFQKNYYNRNDKWQKDIKDRIYKNYYNKDIRTKYSNLNTEDYGADQKENKVKYMDWTENNSIQGNTISVKSNKMSNNTNINLNLKKIINNNKLDNLGKNAQDNNYELNEDELINMNYNGNSNNSKSSKSKITQEKEENDNIDINNREILFEIKLSEEEYNMLLKQKNKNQKKLNN